MLQEITKHKCDSLITHFHYRRQWRGCSEAPGYWWQVSSAVMSQSEGAPHRISSTPKFHHQRVVVIITGCLLMYCLSALLKIYAGWKSLLKKIVIKNVFTSCKHWIEFVLFYNLFHPLHVTCTELGLSYIVYGDSNWETTIVPEKNHEWRN